MYSYEITNLQLQNIKTAAAFFALFCFLKITSTEIRYLLL